MAAAKVLRGMYNWESRIGIEGWIGRLQKPKELKLYSKTPIESLSFGPAAFRARLNRNSNFWLLSSMGPAPRERYNAKARQATAGGSKKKGKIIRNQPAGDTSEANVLFHTPKTKEEKELDRKEKLKQEVRLNNNNFILVLKPISAHLSSRIKMDEQEKKEARKIHCIIALLFNLDWDLISRYRTRSSKPTNEFRFLKNYRTLRFLPSWNNAHILQPESGSNTFYRSFSIVFDTWNWKGDHSSG